MTPEDRANELLEEWLRGGMERTAEVKRGSGFGDPTWEVVLWFRVGHQMYRLAVDAHVAYEGRDIVQDKEDPSHLYGWIADPGVGPSATIRRAVALAKRWQRRSSASR